MVAEQQSEQLSIIGHPNLIRRFDYKCLDQNVFPAFMLKGSEKAPCLLHWHLWHAHRCWKQHESYTVGTFCFSRGGCSVTDILWIEGTIMHLLNSILMRSRTHPLNDKHVQLKNLMHRIPEPFGKTFRWADQKSPHELQTDELKRFWNIV